MQKEQYEKIKYSNAQKRIDRKKRILEEVERLNPIDDIMFRKMAEDIEFCQEILRVILNDDKLVVVEAIPQWYGTNLKGRSVILDVKCVRGDGTLVDVEVQKSDNDDHQKRVRYNGAILTTNVTDPGTKFQDVPNVCVVYISRFDIFKKNRALYHIDRTIRETGDTVCNGFEEVYVNAAVHDGSDVSELMRVFTEDNTYNDKFPRTSENKRIYKNVEGGKRNMSESLEQLLEEVREEGREEKDKETAIRMLDINLPITVISQVTDLSVDEIEEIRQDMLQETQ
jgi:hypothetical protein